MTNGQSNFITFETLFKTNDTLKLKTLLADWEKNNPDDPELYTCSFNYYFLKSKQEFVSIEKEQHGEESFAVTDSSGNLVGFMNSGLSYNSKMLKKAFDYIDKGIIKFPDRLDMRFGKCFVLGEIGDYTNFTKEID